MSNVTVVCGVNELTSESYVDRTIEDVRRELRTPLNISDQAEVQLNGERVEDPQKRLQAGDQLEFIKSSGQKGCL